jgi:hypothetical protein
VLIVQIIHLRTQCRDESLSKLVVVRKHFFEPNYTNFIREISCLEFIQKFLNGKLVISSVPPLSINDVVHTCDSVRVTHRFPPRWFGS